MTVCPSGVGGASGRGLQDGGAKGVSQGHLTLGLMLMSGVD